MFKNKIVTILNIMCIFISLNLLWMFYFVTSFSSSCFIIIYDNKSLKTILYFSLSKKGWWRAFNIFPRWLHVIYMLCYNMTLKISVRYIYLVFTFYLGVFLHPLILTDVDDLTLVSWDFLSFLKMSGFLIHTFLLCICFCHWLALWLWVVA